MAVRRATRADLPRLAAIHAEAFAGEMGPLVGRPYLEAFLGWFVSAPEAVSLVADYDGRPGGYVFGAPDGYGPGLTRRLLPAIARGVLRNLPRVVAHPSFRRQVRSRVANLVLRREASGSIAAATPAGCFCLVGIGTAADARGKGLARALITAFCGMTARPVILDVFEDNRPARTLYAACGFTDLAHEGRVVRMIRQPS